MSGGRGDFFCVKREGVKREAVKNVVAGL